MHGGWRLAQLSVIPDATARIRHAGHAVHAAGKRSCWPIQVRKVISGLLDRPFAAGCRHRQHRHLTRRRFVRRGPLERAPIAPLRNESKAPPRWARRHRGRLQVDTTAETPAPPVPDDDHAGGTGPRSHRAAGPSVRRRTVNAGHRVASQRFDPVAVVITRCRPAVTSASPRLCW